MSVNVIDFGKGPNGEALYKYTMKNENGTELSVINFGCIITNFLFKGNDGKVRDVILGYENVEDYFNDDKCLGAIVGPLANRTADACFEIDGKEYKLEVNDNGRNNLHTAKLGALQKRVWDASTGDNSVTFTIDKADMDLGLPGNLKAKVVYTLTEDDEIKIDYDVTTDKKTIINMTNHTYFNLNGHESGSILDESVVFNADSFVPVDDESIPTGAVAKVAGTPMDFTVAKKIGEMLDMNYEQLKFTNGFDHNYCINDWDGSLKLAVTVIDDNSGIVMETFTDLPGVQFYIGNYLGGENGKGGAKYGQRQGLCLESQYYPNSAKEPNFARPLFDESKGFKSTTVYKFSNVAE
ncbi:MAG: galactose mutarotase [Lachnospiraceae bacterium]|nr:galactose mutarotase [Lachnospiraceae bacterium]